MADSKPTSGTLKTLIGAIILALIAGTSSPWWYDRLFPKAPPPAIQDTSRATPGPAPAAAAATSMSALEYDKAYLQGDIYSKPSVSAEDCSTLCLNEEKCKAMTYIKSQQLCWIKGAVQGSASTSDMISAFKQAPK